jgi:hypothetical protein
MAAHQMHNNYALPLEELRLITASDQQVIFFPGQEIRRHCYTLPNEHPCQRIILQNPISFPCGAKNCLPLQIPPDAAA